MSRAVDLAQRALPLHERIRHASLLDEVPTRGIHKVDERLERWRQRVASGDAVLFEKRLTWDGLDITAARGILSDSAPRRALHPLPSWVSTLDTLLCSLREPDELLDADRKARPDPSNLAFEDLLRPLRCLARKRLHHALADRPSARARLLPTANLALERRLDHRLEDIWGRAVLSSFRESLPLGVRLAASQAGAQNRDSYDSFVASVLADGYQSLFDELPVLGRLTALAIDQWVRSTGELLVALEADWSALESFLKRRLRTVAQIEGYSDFHNGGRSVAVICFEGGARVVFKPRTLGIDAAYSRLLQWCSSIETLPELRHLRVLERSHYGWMEFAEAGPCATEEAGRAYFLRAGMLLFLLYLLDGTDCHYENMVAMGEHPCAIDLETLFSPRHKVGLPTEVVRPAEVLALEVVHDSVLRTGLLPYWRISPVTGTPFDVSGLATTPFSSPPGRVLQWRNLQSNGIHLAEVDLTNHIGKGKNVATLDGKLLSAEDHLDALKSGFEGLYRAVMLRKDALLRGNDSPLGLFRDLNVRFVFRDTWQYGLLLRNTVSKKHLDGGVERGIEFEVLARPFLQETERPIDWPLFKAELFALENLDIPHFAGRTNSSDVSDVTGTLVKDYLDCASYERVVERISRLSALDMERQVTILECCLSVHTLTVSRPVTDETTAASPKTLDKSVLLAEAQALAAEIARRRIRSDDGTAAWTGLVFRPDLGRAEYRVLGAGCYDGVCGIALFFGALYKVTRTAESKELALAAVTSVRRLLHDSDTRLLDTWARSVGLGGATGLGSLLYTFTLLASLLEDGAFLEDAQLLAELLTNEWIESDRQLDVVSGVAGTILGLLALDRHHPDPRLLTLAEACGSHLLVQQQATGGWHNNVAQLPLTGMSHGASGIGMALVRLGSRIQRDDLLAAAHCAFRYERELYDPEQHNWPDLRQGSRDMAGEPYFMTTWCHGASGIGLARLDALEELHSVSAVREEMEIAFATTRDEGLGMVDGLCCGNAGRADILLEAGRRLGRPGLVAEAGGLLSETVARARHRGHYTLFPDLPRPVFSPGFFQGVAGIGYALLRHVDGRLPSVLRWADWNDTALA